MNGTPPFFLEKRLTEVLRHLEELTRARGLGEAFATELISVRLTVQQALAFRSRGLAALALEEIALLEARVRRAPPRPSPVDGSVRQGGR